MASLNKVFLIGRLTRDPELRYTPNGTAVADLRLAVNDNYSDRDGKRVDRTLFVDVVAWQRQAETASEYLSKGSSMFVEGRLQMDEWENKEGEKRSKIRVVARNIQFLGSRGDGEGGGRRPAQPEGAGQAAPAGPPPGKAPGSADVGEDDIPF